MALPSHPGLKVDDPLLTVIDGLVSRWDVSPARSLKGSLRGVMERALRACRQSPSQDHSA